MFVISPERAILGRLSFLATEEETIELLLSTLENQPEFAGETDPLGEFIPDPNDPAQTALASLEVRWKNGERASMIAPATEWLEEYGDEWDHGDAVARTMLGSALYHAGDFDGADDTWSEVVDRHPEHPLRHRALHNKLDRWTWLMPHHPDINDARHPKPGERQVIDPHQEARLQNLDKVFSNPSYRSSPSGFPFVRIPAGTFVMGGDPPLFERESPLRRVTISRDTWVSAFPVTLGQWRRFRPLEIFDSKDERVDQLPVQRVSFEDAEEFCEILSKEDGITYRLPTEAEWEYAARGSIEGAEYPWGDEIADESRCNYLYSQGVPVASYPPNGFGLFDMAGNCQEWTSDLYAENAYELTPRDVTDPKGPTSRENSKKYPESRVVRGGYIGIEYSKFVVRNANRLVNIAAGFRLIAEF
jgi:formylglycine-generating enzyme required for sulfatase activity